MTRQLPQGAPRSGRPQHSRAAFSPEIVDEIQRRRIVDSLVAVSAECGYGAITIQHILRHARMGAQTFYTHFDSREDCLLAAYRVLADRLGAELGGAWAAAEGWSAKVRAGVNAALAIAAQDPAAARLLTVEVQAGDDKARAVQAESIERLAAKLREGRDTYPEAAGLHPATEYVVVAGLVALLGNRLLDGEANRSPTWGPELVELALTPFVGAERARHLARS